MNIRVVCTDVRFLPAGDALEKGVYRAEFRSDDKTTLPHAWVFGETLKQFEVGEVYMLKIEEL